MRKTIEPAKYPLVFTTLSTIPRCLVSLYIFLVVDLYIESGSFHESVLLLVFVDVPFYFPLLVRVPVLFVAIGVFAVFFSPFMPLSLGSSCGLIHWQTNALLEHHDEGFFLLSFSKYNNMSADISQRTESLTDNIVYFIFSNHLCWLHTAVFHAQLNQSSGQGEGGQAKLLNAIKMVHIHYINETVWQAKALQLCCIGDAVAAKLSRFMLRNGKNHMARWQGGFRGRDEAEWAILIDLSICQLQCFIGITFLHRAKL
eukprot:m.74319 g.74319  ORF g.74319 m.74319 type:complete len:257 (-) comp13935_c0_seq1:717-1487(-)